MDVKRRLLATKAKILLAKTSKNKKPPILLVIALYFLKKLTYFLEKPLREQVSISKPMNPAHAKGIIIEVSKECDRKYCQQKEVKKKALMESLHKVFLKMIKEAKERMCIPHEPKKPEEIIDAEEILQENEVAKEWQVTALNELLEPMSTNIDSKMSKMQISHDITAKTMRKTATTGFFKDNWTSNLGGANLRYTVENQDSSLSLNDNIP